MTQFETKDSGQHQQYDSGMRRETEAGKPRFDLILTERQPYNEQMMTRYAAHLARGTEKYDARNWEDGDSRVELDRAKSSLLRHVMQLVTGEDDEDHAAAVWFNTQAVEYFRWRIKQKTESLAGVTLELKGTVSPEFMELVFGESQPVERWVTAKHPEWTDVGWIGPAPKVDELVTDHPDVSEDAKARHRGMLNDWHNRPKSEDIAPRIGDKVSQVFSVPAGSDEAARIRARIELELADLIRQPGLDLAKLPTKRVEEWLKQYSVELLEGNLGENYERIHQVEFAMRFRRGARKIAKSPVDDMMDFD